MAYDFDERWLDVDFIEEARLADRRLGLVEKPIFGASFVPFEERFTEIPESDWTRLIEQRAAEKWSARDLVVAICDQDGEPSCTSNATVKSHEIRQAIQFGKDRVIQGSPISVYRHVGSRSSGSSVDDNAEYLQKYGFLPLDNDINRTRGIQGLHPHNGYGTREPDNHVELRKPFRAPEIVIARTFNQFMSMILGGAGGIVYGRQGHAICNVDVKLDSRGRRVFPYANSWNETWGDNGFGVDSESQIRMGAGWAYAVTSVAAHPVHFL